MTSAHIFFIPLVLLVGIVIGVIVGRRSVLVQQAEEERQRRLAEKKAARLAGAEPAPPTSTPKSP